MKLKMDFNPEVSYSVGDVVIYKEDVYHLQRVCPAGTTPYNTLYWGPVNETIAENVLMIRDAVQGIADSIPTNISDDAIVLKGTDDAEYLITVDDSGETPELLVEAIDNEGGEG